MRTNPRHPRAVRQIREEGETMGGDQLKSESAAGDWHPTDDALSTEPSGGSRRMGTILKPSAPTVSVTRREVEIRHHERQLCAMELLILAERHDSPNLPAYVLRSIATLIARREVA